MGFLFLKRSSSKQGKAKKTKRLVRFTNVAAQRHEYEFEWDLAPDYWFSRDELKSFNEVRWEEADALRRARGILTSSRDDADALEAGLEKNVFIGDTITRALDDVDEDREISIRGIEHFVWPVLQKEMIGRKKELKRKVLGRARDPGARRRDPQGLDVELARESAVLSKWARDVATERGIKYCEMKRGMGGGGGLLKASKLSKPGQGLRNVFRNASSRSLRMGASKATMKDETKVPQRGLSS